MDTNTPTRITLSVSGGLAVELDQARGRISSDLKTRISMNAVAARYIRMGLDAEAAETAAALPAG